MCSRHRFLCVCIIGPDRQNAGDTAGAETKVVSGKQRGIATADQEAVRRSLRGAPCFTSHHRHTSQFSQNVAPANGEVDE